MVHRVDNSEAVRYYTRNTRSTSRAPREFPSRDVDEQVSRAGVELDVAT